MLSEYNGKDIKNSKKITDSQNFALKRRKFYTVGIIFGIIRDFISGLRNQGVLDAAVKANLKMRCGPVERPVLPTYPIT